MGPLAAWPAHGLTEPGNINCGFTSGRCHHCDFILFYFLTVSLGPKEEFSFLIFFLGLLRVFPDCVLPHHSGHFGHRLGDICCPSLFAISDHH